MNSRTLRIAIAQVSPLVTPGIRQIIKQHPAGTIPFTVSNPVCRILQEHLRNAVPGYRPHLSFTPFVEGLRDNVPNFDADDVTESLTRYILNGETPDITI